MSTVISESTGQHSVIDLESGKEGRIELIAPAGNGAPDRGRLSIRIPVWSGFVARSRGRRLEGHALALMATTASTALLGMAFWAIALRLYSAGEVGRYSAILSALLLLATLAQLNLGNVYGRYLARAGATRRRMVFTGYGAVIVFALVLGTLFVVLGFGDALFVTPQEAWLFPVCVAVLAVFALEDWVLVAVHRAGWVLVENLAFGAAKLVVLALAAASFPQLGIGLAWMLPAAAVVVAVSLFLAGAGTRSAADEPAVLPSRRELGHAVASEYITGVVTTALPLLLPLVVAYRLGVEANAYFALPWLVASSMLVLVSSITAVLLVEASANPLRFTELLRRATRLSIAVTLSGAAVVWLVAPTLLGLLGPGIAEHGTWLLRIAVLAAPAYALVVVWITAMRLRGRMSLVIALEISTGVGILGTSLLMADSLGIVAVGVGFLIVQTTAACLIAIPLWKLLRRPPGRHALSNATRRNANVVMHESAFTPEVAASTMTAPPASLRLRGMHRAPGISSVQHESNQRSAAYAYGRDGVSR